MLKVCWLSSKVTEVTALESGLVESALPKTRVRQAFCPVAGLGRKPIPVAHYVQRVALLPLLPFLRRAANQLHISYLRCISPLARWMQFHLCLPAWGKDRGATLTTLFGNTAVPTVAATAAPPIAAPATGKKRGWLPLLTVLFLISYGLMTMLIVEQGATIESQRALIRELFRDSAELSAMKTKARQDTQDTSVADGQRHGQTRSATTEAPVTQDPSSQFRSSQNPSSPNPSTQYPSSQAPAVTAPSSQAARQHRTKNQTEKQKPQFQMPSKLASDLVDDPRTLNVI
jgi:hypothetical protein